MTKPIVIITGADTPTGLTTVRSLREHPVECWGVAEDRKSASCSSRYWSHMEILHGFPEEQVRSLIELGRKALRQSGQKPLLLFSQDEWVLRANDNRDALSEYFRMVIPDHKNLLTLMDKARFHEWALSREYALPKAVIAGSRDELCRAASEMPVPFIVKPLVRTSQWDKVYINQKFITCPSDKSAEELQNNAERLMALSPRYVIQEWIAGEDEDVVFCLLCADEKGRILDVFTGRKLWQWPPLEGSTAICTDFNNREIESESVALMMDAGHKGLGSLEFKFNRNNGRFQITEPTVGRNDYQSLVAVCAGHNLTGRLVESVFDLPEINSKKSRRVIWIDEISALRRARVDKLGFIKLLKWMIVYSMVRKCFLIFDFRDLSPFRRKFRKIF